MFLLRNRGLRIPFQRMGAKGGVGLAPELRHCPTGVLVRGHLLARVVLTLRNFVLCAPTQRRSGQLVVGPSEASFFRFLNQRASCTTFETKFKGIHDPLLRCRFWRLVEHKDKSRDKNPLK